MMMESFLSRFSRTSPKLRSIIYKPLYQFMARSYQKSDWKFMNYGYAPVSGENLNIRLDEADIDNRFCIQLYDHCAELIDLRGLEVLEVGSGRGGGADYIKRYLEPEKMVGMDFSEEAVRLSNENYDLDGLSFKTGNAESLPFRDSSFDVVINVESSHCYSSMDAFLAQVQRVLRQGGYFLYADFRRTEDVEKLRQSLTNSGLRLINETDITQNIIEALKLDHERKTALIKDQAPKPLAGFFHEFSGTNGSLIYDRFIRGETMYLSFVFQK